MLPQLARVAVLWNAANPYSAIVFKETQAAGRTLGIEVQSLEMRGPDDFDGAFAAARQQHPGALIDDAAYSAMNALHARPNYLTACRIAAASDVLAGRTEQGRRFIAKMRAADPKLRLSDLPELLPFRRKSDFDRWAGALQAAGLPD